MLQEEELCLDLVLLIWAILAFPYTVDYWNSSYEAHLQELKKVHHLHKVFQNPFHLF